MPGDASECHRQEGRPPSIAPRAQRRSAAIRADSRCRPAAVAARRPSSSTRKPPARKRARAGRSSRIPGQAAAALLQPFERQPLGQAQAHQESSVRISSAGQGGYAPISPCLRLSTCLSQASGRPHGLRWRPAAGNGEPAVGAGADTQPVPGAPVDQIVAALRPDPAWLEISYAGRPASPSKSCVSSHSSACSSSSSKASRPPRGG